MRVLLVQQDLGHGWRARPIYPIGLGCLAARLVPAHEVRVMDPNLFPGPSAHSLLRREIRSFAPDVIGLSIKYIDTTSRTHPYVYYAHVPPLVSLIKAERPGSAIVAGGAGFSIFATDIMNDVPFIDFGVFLEGEESFPELAASLDHPEKVPGIFFRKNGSVVFTGDRTRPSLRSGEFERIAASIDPAPYVTGNHRIFGIQTKRGCAFECAYCTYPFLNGRTIRLRDPRDVADEIEFLAGRYGLRKFSFADDVFNAPPGHAEAVCREILRRKLDVEWGAWFDLASLTGESLALARRAGCRHIDFSPDASTAEGLKCLGKNLSPRDVAAGIRMAGRERAVTFTFNFFCSHPRLRAGEAWKTLRHWLTIPLRLWRRGRVGLNWIRIYPHTPIYRTALREGLLGERTSLLAKNPGELREFFYRKRPLWLMDLMFLALIKAAEFGFKPLLKLYLWIKGGTYPFYYE